MTPSLLRSLCRDFWDLLFNFWVCVSFSQLWKTNKQTTNKTKCSCYNEVKCCGPMWAMSGMPGVWSSRYKHWTFFSTRKQGQLWFDKYCVCSPQGEIFSVPLLLMPCLTTASGRTVRHKSAKAKIFQIKEFLWAPYFVYFLSGYIGLCPTWHIDTWLVFCTGTDARCMIGK